MRKRTVNHLADTIFWYLVYLLPLFCYLLMYIHRAGTTVPPFSDFMSNNFGMLPLTDIVSDCLFQLFGADGILPLAGANLGIPLFSWYVSMVIIHLAVDFLLFIPRLAHSFMDKFTKGDC